MASSLSQILILTASFLYGCAGAETAPHAEPPTAPVSAKLSLVHQENLDTIYRSGGTVRGRTTAVLTSKTTGYVRSVDVRPGDRVNAGQLLALREANDSSALLPAYVRSAAVRRSSRSEPAAMSGGGLLAAVAVWWHSHRPSVVHFSPIRCVGNGESRRSARSRADR